MVRVSKEREIPCARRASRQELIACRTIAGKHIPAGIQCSPGAGMVRGACLDILGCAEGGVTPTLHNPHCRIFTIFTPPKGLLLVPDGGHHVGEEGLYRGPVEGW